MDYIFNTPLMEYGNADPEFVTRQTNHQQRENEVKETKNVHYNGFQRTHSFKMQAALDDKQNWGLTPKW